jgi:hypothetical protein
MTAPDNEASAAETTPKKGFLRRHWGKLTIAVIVLVPALVFTIWAGSALSYTYSSGQRVGFVQKFSKKGWICKTWEGELAMVNFPGSLSQIFTFTVRGDSVAKALTDAMAKGQVRVEIQYDQHRGVPTSCFGETEYFVTGVRVVPD